MGDRDEFVLDMSSTVVAQGKIRRAHAAGAALEEGAALDPHGEPTIDPSLALAGTMLPVGGPKGSGLALAISLLVGLLAARISTTKLHRFTPTSHVRRTSDSCSSLSIPQASRLSASLRPVWRRSPTDSMHCHRDPDLTECGTRARSQPSAPESASDPASRSRSARSRL